MATHTNRLDEMSPHHQMGTPHMKVQNVCTDKPPALWELSAAALSKLLATNKDSSPVSRLDTEIDFAEMKDGTLVELVEDCQNPGRRCLAIWKNGEIRFLDRLEQDGQVFVPRARDREILESIRLPRGAESYGSAQELVTGLESLIKLCIAVDKNYLPVLANFVLSTWFVDRFLVAPYLLSWDCRSLERRRC